MTYAEIMKLDERALDKAIANSVMEMRKGKFHSHWLDASGHRICGCPDYEPTCHFPPQYSTDLNACREAEMRLVSTHAKDYMWSLISLTFGGEINLHGPSEWLIMALATAKTRCRAMLLAKNKGAK